jgi:ABC-type Zn2+ transport system substrate-binding protein/surface adhesin
MIHTFSFSWTDLGGRFALPSDCPIHCTSASNRRRRHHQDQDHQDHHQQQQHQHHHNRNHPTTSSLITSQSTIGTSSKIIAVVIEIGITATIAAAHGDLRRGGKRHRQI